MVSGGPLPADVEVIDVDSDVIIDLRSTATTPQPPEHSADETSNVSRSKGKKRNGKAGSKGKRSPTPMKIEPDSETGAKAADGGADGEEDEPTDNDGDESSESDSESGSGSERASPEPKLGPEIEVTAPTESNATDEPAPKEGTGSEKPRSEKPAAKPKSKVVRSPSPPPPPPPKPRPTLRLDIPLGGPDNYEVDIVRLSIDAGQLPEDVMVAPPPAAAPVESEPESEEEREAAKKRGRKPNAQEYYDVHDPFIDDSELAIDERSHMAQTKQKGFYVSLGEVQLLKEKGDPMFGTPIKPKSKVGKAEVDGDGQAGQGSGTGTSGGRLKRKNEEPGFLGGYAADGRKRRKVESDGAFSPELQAVIDAMKAKVNEEEWAKGKFPPKLKPHLADMAFQAIASGEYDERFFALMPKIFPYNRFTMTKLIKRLVYEKHYDFLMKQQDEKLLQLKQVADEGFEKAQEEWERSVKMWRHRMEVKQAEKKDDEGGGGAASAGDGDAEDAEPAMMPLTQADGEAMDVDSANQAAGAANSSAQATKDANPPPKRYRMTDRIRELIWELVSLSNESVKITNEKNSLENNSEPAQSEQGVRKVLYQRIVAAFPEGWMNSGNISREISAIKKKLEKEEQEEAI